MYHIVYGAVFVLNALGILAGWSPRCPTSHPAQRHACIRTNEEVSGSPHLPVFGDDIDDQGIAHQPHQHDECKEEGHKPGVGQEGVLISIVLTTNATFSLGGISLRAIDPQLLGGVPELLRRLHGATARWVIEQRRETQNAEGGQRRVRSAEEWVIVILCGEFPCEPLTCWVPRVFSWGKEQTLQERRTSQSQWMTAHEIDSTLEKIWSNGNGITRKLHVCGGKSSTHLKVTGMGRKDTLRLDDSCCCCSKTIRCLVRWISWWHQYMHEVKYQTPRGKQSYPQFPLLVPSP